VVNKNATIDVCHTSSVSSGRYGNVILTLPLSLAFFLNGSHLSNDSLEVREEIIELLYAVLASCLIYAWALPAHPYSMHLSIVWVRSFIEPDLFETMYRSTIPLRFI